MKLRFLISAVLSAALIFALGCSDDTTSSNNPPAQADSLSFDGSGGGPIYIDFSTGATTNPADPMDSTDWDIAFEAYEIHQNSSIFGSGQAATYPVWLDQSDSTDFDETTTAPTVPNAYFIDGLGSVLTNWYNYDGTTHQLSSKNHVYIIRHNDEFYKLQISSYYRDIGGTPVSAWYTFKWLALVGPDTSYNGVDSMGTSTTTWDDEGYWETILDATSTSHFMYYSFSNRDTMTLTDEEAASNTDWRIAFKRDAVILNGGVSGMAEVDGVDLAGIEHADSTNFDTTIDPLTIVDTDFESDSYNLTIDDWYIYDHVNFEVYPTNYVYIMKDAEGNYVKFQIVAIDNEGMPPNMGTITIKYIFAGTDPSFE